MSKKKLVILRGAGSSVEYGVPGTGQIDRYLLDESRKWASRVEENNFYQMAVDASFRSGYYTGDDTSTNSFEDALALFPRLLSWKTQRGDPFARLLSSSDLKVKSVGAGVDYDDFISRVRYRDQYCYLVNALGNFVGSHCKNIDRESVKDHVDFIGALSDEFDIAMFDLNYDSVSDVSAPGYFNGFLDGAFDPSSVHSKAFGDELYHLHGSVYFRAVQDRDDVDIVIRRSDVIEERASFLPEHEYDDERFDGLITPHAAIVSGGFKSDQLLREPFSSYFSTLVRRVGECDAILVCGYGFRDVHVNRVIENRIQGAKQSPAVVIVDYFDDDVPYVGEGRPGIWARNISRSLRVGEYHFMKGILKFGKHRYSRAEFRRQRMFEETDDKRVSIWGFGFRDALKHPESIIARLMRGAKGRIGYRQFF